MQVAAWGRRRCEASRNAALCNSQGHRPWETGAPYLPIFRAPTGRPEERTVGTWEQRCGIGALAAPGAMPLVAGWAFGPRRNLPLA